MSQESDLQGQIDRVWRNLCEVSQNQTIANGDLCKRMEALERGAKMEAQTSLELRSMIGELADRIDHLEEAKGRAADGLMGHERRISALENAERTGCPSGYFTVNGGPLRPCLVTLMKRYKIGKPKTATQVDQDLNERMSAPHPTCVTCRWFKEDSRIAVVGSCVAHPNEVRKHRCDTCGEHSP